MNLSAHNINFSIQQRKLLDAVSISLTPGKITALLGANGAGKSTLLKVLSGELSTYKNAVHLNNKRLSDWSINEQARLRAVLSQNINLNFPFKAIDVVLMGRTPYNHRQANKIDFDIAEEALFEMSALHLRNQTYTSLSGGERQRIQLARVLSQIWLPSDLGPQYLLLDEPTSALDIEHQHALLKTLKKFASKAIGIGIVLHDINLAARYTDEIYILKNGRCIAQGDANDVIQPNILKDAFKIDCQVKQYAEIKKPQIMVI